MEEVHVKARGHAAVICCAQCDRAERAAAGALRLRRGGGEGKGLGPHLVHPHIERALTDFALKRQASFPTTHRNNTTRLPGRRSLVAERISTSYGYTHDTLNTSLSQSGRVNGSQWFNPGRRQCHNSQQEGKFAIVLLSIFFFFFW